MSSATVSHPCQNLPVEGIVRTKPLRVCMILHEVLGPTQNNGLGTAYALLGEALAAAGHKVTFLYATSKCERETLDHWTDYYKGRAIEFAVLPPKNDVTMMCADWQSHPYRIYLWLKDKNYDVIHFPEYPGNGFYLTSAKHLGLAFADTSLCVGTHGPSMWSRETNGFAINAAKHLAMDFMERQTVGYADVLISPSQYMVQWLRNEKWKLPPQTYVQQNIQSPYALALGKGGGFRTHAPREIVFYGRIEPRKGYHMFCDALDSLPKQLLDGMTVTFLGSSTKLYSGDTLDEVKQRAVNWACDTKFLTDKSHEEALDYLSVRPCFAVIPSLDENLCYVAMECIGAGIPFIASHAGGIPELIAEQDRNRVCFSPVNAETLAKRLAKAVVEGLDPANPAVDFSENRQRWLNFHTHISYPVSPAPPNEFTRQNASLISVVIAPCEQSGRAVLSLGEQDYPNVEVLYAEQKPGQGVGVALNEAVDKAKGDYIQIMDGDDVAKPYQLSFAMRIALRTEADMLTSFFETYKGRHPVQQSDHICMPLGGSIEVSAFRNAFGTGNVLIRRKKLEEVGGFPETDEDDVYAAFFRRALQRGASFDVIPEPLYQCPFPKVEKLLSFEHPFDAERLKSFRDHLSPGVQRILFSKDKAKE